MLHSFQGSPNDGYFPFGAVVLDKQGNVYGTTSGGGTNNAGTVFELTPPATSGGAWPEKLLLMFDGGAGGYSPQSKLVMDAAGNLYGTTFSGFSNGVVFELVAPDTAGGPWAERILHVFASPMDGANPQAGLLLRGGILYGTTYYGGMHGKGVVFRLVRKPGPWTETVLHSFTGIDGENPYAEVVSDSAGNLYGATTSGGTAACACGAVFELSPPTASGDPWQETTLYSFTRHSDGLAPYSALWRDKLGGLYGTVSRGGTDDAGKVFKLKPPTVAGGAWSYVVLHSFAFTGTYPSDGVTPLGTLILHNGALYGATAGGGLLGSDGFSNGVVFSIVP